MEKELLLKDLTIFDMCQKLGIPYEIEVNKNKYQTFPINPISNFINEN